MSSLVVTFFSGQKKKKEKKNTTKQNTTPLRAWTLQYSHVIDLKKKKKHTTHFYLPLHPYSLTEVLSLSSLFFRAMSVSIDLENQLHSSGTEKIPQALKKN